MHRGSSGGKLDLKSDRSPFAERGAESAKARFAENQPLRAILLVQNLIEESSFSQDGFWDFYLQQITALVKGKYLSYCRR